VVAGERDGALLPRRGDRPLGVGSSAEHVSQRPKLLCAASDRRREDSIECVAVRVRVPEYGYQHAYEGERAPRDIRRRVTGARDPVMIADA
jgi:hypothetical protein